MSLLLLANFPVFAGAENAVTYIFHDMRIERTGADTVAARHVARSAEGHEARATYECVMGADAFACRVSAVDSSTPLLWDTVAIQGTHDCWDAWDRWDGWNLRVVGDWAGDTWPGIQDGDGWSGGDLDAATAVLGDAALASVVDAGMRGVASLPAGTRVLRTTFSTE